MFDHTTVINFLAAWGVVLSVGIAVKRWQQYHRSKPSALRALQQSIAERKARLEKAAGTDYRPKGRSPWNP